MKVTVLRKEFSGLLNMASRFASSRAQLPILENVVIQASKTKLNVMATNLEISVSATIGAKVEEEGSLAVPARVINDLINNLKSDTVEIESKKEQIKIISDGFNASVVGMNTSDFPAIPTSGGSKAISLPSKNLVDVLSKVMFSVSRDDTRPVLTGVLLVFDSSSKKMTAISSDGFRLSQKSVKIAGGISDERVIIPRAFLSELTKLLENGDEEVKFEVSKADNQVVVECGNVVMSSRVIEGDFPNFEKIIPKSSRVKVNVGLEDLEQAMKVASVFARDASNVVKIKVGKDDLAVDARSSKSGEQEMRVPARVEGESMEINYNYRFVEEFLGVCEGSEVGIELTDGETAGVFKDGGDKEYFHLIMPVRS